jgi:hypothetical protein
MARKASSKKEASAAGAEGVEVPLPVAVADEIEAVARRTRQSTGFIVRRALAVVPAGAAVAASAGEGPERTVVLTAAEDDPDDLLARIRAAGQGTALTRTVASAWLASRERFLKWADREEQNRHAEESRQAEQEDDLDRELADARAAGTTPERLAQLAGSAYPRVRALVAQHRATPAAALQKLAGDREPAG